MIYMEPLLLQCVNTLYLSSNEKLVPVFSKVFEINVTLISEGKLVKGKLLPNTGNYRKRGGKILK